MYKRQLYCEVSTVISLKPASRVVLIEGRTCPEANRGTVLKEQDRKRKRKRKKEEEEEKKKDSSLLPEKWKRPTSKLSVFAALDKGNEEQEEEEKEKEDSQGEEAILKVKVVIGSS